MRVGALVLAGGTLKGSSQPKSSIMFGDRTMLEYIVDALAQTDAVERIVVVGPAGVLQSLTGVEKVESNGDLLNGLLEGLRCFMPDEYVLAVSNDIPLITATTIETFLNDCRTTTADGYYPIISKETIETAFPGTSRTYGRLIDGTYTGGNILLLRPRVLLDHLDIVEAMYDARKSVTRLARIFGVGFLLRVLFRRLTIRQAEQRMSAVFESPLRAVECRSAEVGIDVDKEADVEFVSGVFARGGDGGA